MSKPEATGREPFTPVTIRDTSATERATFRECRRKWLLLYVHRLGRVEGTMPFLFGTAIHSGLAAYYRAIQAKTDRPVAVADSLDAFWAEWDRVRDELEEDLGGLWQFAEEEFIDTGQLGQAMLLGYDRWESRDPIGKPLEVEQRFEVPIRKGKRILGWLSVQLDLLLRLANRRKAIGDHKTASSAPNSGFIDMNDQMSAYVWAARERFEDDSIRDAVYNVLLKKAPHPPRLLKNGKLSKDKGQLTTMEMYIEEIGARDLPMDEYLEHLDWLRDNEPTLFIREHTHRTRPQLEEFHANLLNEWADMSDVAADPDLAYPNPSALHCPSCPVQPICRTMMDRGDVEPVIRDNYVILDPRR